MPTYCPTCGTSNPDDAKSCHYCDTSLTRFATDGALASGTLIHYRYRITKLIKAGGMGAVYLAKDLKTNKIRAVKELFKQFSPQEEQYVVQRFKEEAEILSRLRHPNLPRVNDYFHDYDRYYLVMDYIQGEDLESVLENEGNPGLPELDVVDWGVQICSVLSYLHSQNPAILYRDTKPSNIMIRYEDGRAMLIDFGLARTIQPGSERGKTAIGTEGYSPPEQYMGNPEPRSDVYALGATMHHLLTGEFPAVPFQFSYVRDLNPDVSKGLEKIVMKALEIEIHDRFPSAKDMLNALLKLYPKIKERLDYLESINLNEDEEEVAVDAPKDEDAEIVEIIDEVDKELAEIDDDVSVIEAEQQELFIQKSQKEEIKREENEEFLTIRKRSDETSDKEKKFVSLVQKLNGRDLVEKEKAIEDLGELNDNRAVPFLIELLEYRDQYFTRVIVKALGKLKDPRSLPSLLSNLDSQDPITRQFAAWALGEIKDLKALKPLVKVLAKGDVGTRASAAYALGNLGSKEALEPLIHAFIEDGDPEVRRYSSESIAQIESGKDITSLIEASDSDDEEMRKDLVLMYFSEYLMESTDKKKKNISPQISDDLAAYADMLKSRDSSIRKEAVQMLGSTKNQKVIPILLNCLDDKDDAVSVEALKCLVELRLKDPEPLIDLLETPRPVVRQMAAWALGEIGDKKALNYLMEALKHDDPGTRASAAYALGNIGDKKVINSLLNVIIEDTDLDTRKNSAESVIQLDSGRDLSMLVSIASEDDRGKRERYIHTSFPEEEIVNIANVDHGTMEKMKHYLVELKSGNVRARKDACRALGNMRLSEAIPYLMEALEDTDENVCRAAGYALARFPGAVKPLISVLKHRNILTVQMAIWALGELKSKEAVTPISEMLISGPVELRENSAYALGNIGDPLANDALFIAIIEDKNMDVRIYSAEALGKIEQKELPRIIDAARSDDKVFRHTILCQHYPYAREILEEMCEKSASIKEEESFMPELSSLEDEDIEVRKNTVLLLASKYKNKALPYILPLLDDIEEVIRDTAIIALADIKDKSVSEELIDFIDDPSLLIQQRAIWALGELKSELAVEPLLEMLQNGDPPIRASAAYALGNIEDKRAIDKLCNSMINDEDPYVRKYSAESLGQIKDKRATKSILQALKNENDEEVRKVIAKVFSQLRFMDDPFKV